MIIRLLTLFIAIFQLSFLAAQEGTLKGRIADAKTKEGLGGVSIYVDGKGVAVSDTGGNYQTQCSAGSHSVEFKFIGYSTLVHKVDIKENETMWLNLSLSVDATELGTIVISAGKFEQKLEEVTVSMDVMKQALIENKNTTNMEDLMQQCPGVNILDGQANIRGGSGFSYGAGTRVMVLVDDLPLLTADAGDVKWNFIPIENVEQVEIIKGASSALFGSSALNGVINFRTSYPKDTARTSVSISSGFYDEPKRRELKWWDKDVSLAGGPLVKNLSFLNSQQINNLDLILGGNVYEDNGYRQLEKEQRMRFNFNSRYRFQKVKGLAAGINENFMVTNGGYFILWQSGDSAYYPQGGSVSNYHTIRSTIDPFITYFTPKGHRHSLKTRYYLATNENNTNQESISKVWFGEYQYQLHLKKELNITSGITGTYSEVIADSMYGNHFSSNVGIFSQVDKKFDRLVLSFGARGEYFKVDTAETKTNIILGKDTSIIPIHPVARAGLNYRLFPKTHLRASFGQGYRFPSVAEKFISTQVSGLTVYPNPKIQPEKGWSAEVGAKQAFKLSGLRGYVDVAGFWQEYVNMMEFTFDYWVPPGTPNPNDPYTKLMYFGAKSVNVGRAQIKGAEVTVAAEGKIGKATITLLGGYTYIKPIDLDYDSTTLRAYYKDSLVAEKNLKSGGSYNGNILKYRYEHTAKIDLQVDYKKWSAGISVRYNSFMKNIDASFQDPLLVDIYPILPKNYTYILPGLKEYRQEHNTGDVVLDYRISYAIAKGVKTSMVVNNAFNREYMGRPGDVQPPRSFAFMLSVKI
ncbi:MAG: TonB-dependent receptor [Bacteroidetes bacterium]|nr:TonB-dependent receptor [Bacteroidota bacterium]